MNEFLGPRVIGMEAAAQADIDKALLEVDRTENKGNMGANAILGVSMAVCKAGAAARKIPL